LPVPPLWPVASMPLASSRLTSWLLASQQRLGMALQVVGQLSDRARGARHFGHGLVHATLLFGSAEGLVGRVRHPFELVGSAPQARDQHWNLRLDLSHHLIDAGQR